MFKLNSLASDTAPHFVCIHYHEAAKGTGKELKYTNFIEQLKALYELNNC